MYHVRYSDCYYYHHNSIVVEVPGDRRRDHHRGFWFSAFPIRFVSPFVDKNYSGILNRATELLPLPSLTNERVILGIEKEGFLCQE